ncbi:hypothetical protein HJC23_000293 [Cyclotella cryptica]|uniref:Uncharacterized protein n=1 Tax=Cyclotella cryptica TaxID=29204 RepID=A0ABD3QBQ1_9STRA
MVDTTPLIPTSSGSESKQGHKIFCCCCDSKRAVQIFNILAIISVVIMMTLLSVNKYADVEVDVNGDPYADQELHELKANYRYYMIAYAVGLGVYLIVLCQDEEGWIFGYIVWPIVWEMLYIYPHAVFISEINRGIMTPETYARERHSCCCV